MFASELEECSDAGWVGTVGVPSRDFLTYHFFKITPLSVDKDLGFNFLLGVVTVMN